MATGCAVRLDSMNLRLSSAGLLLILFACTHSAARRSDEDTICPPDPPPPSVQLISAPAHTISGEVGQADAARPAQGVRVQVLELRRMTYTDTVGRFRFDTIPPGRYTLVFRQIGMVAREVRGVAVSAQEGRSLVVHLKMAVLDGCPGFGEVVIPEPWWKFW